jgi:hypothetical protein
MENKEELKDQIDKLVSTHQENIIERNCLICYRDIDESFVLQCNCNICKKCLYNWVTEKNYSALYKEMEISCPNHECRKEISITWLYCNLKPGNISVINEILFLKYSVICKDIRKCPKSNCHYFGFTDGKKCRNEFRCEVCFETWYDPDLKLITKLDLIKNLSFTIKHNLLEFLTELVVFIYCRPCIYCGFIIYRFEGCKHMTCGKCNGEYCEVCLTNWKVGHDEIKCETKIDIVIIFTLNCILTCVLKLILSFYYLRMITYWILKALSYQLSISSYILILLSPLIIRAKVYERKIIYKEAKIKMNLFIVAMMILIEIFHIYLSYKSEWITNMNYLLLYEFMIITGIISLYFAVKGWKTLIANTFDEIKEYF